jgi:hypothetical protein
MLFISLFSIFKTIKHTFIFYILYFLILICFTLIYWYFGTSENFNFNKASNNNRDSLTFINALYFSFITQSTTGYGDITPKTESMRIMVILQLTFLALYFII